MHKNGKILFFTLAMSIGFSMVSFANRFDPKTHVGPLTPEDIQDMEADLAEQEYLDNLPSIAYDENTDSYYEDFYLNAAPGEWMSDENGKWYQLDADSYYANGWVRIEGKRYYMDEKGYAKIGWIQIGQKWYYTDEDGKLVTGSRLIDGVTYSFDAFGVMEA